MGKGDKKSKRGKIIAGSYGKSRMRKASTPLYVSSVELKEKIEKKPKETAKSVAKPKAKVAAKKPEEKETKTAKPKVDKAKKTEE